MFFNNNPKNEINVNTGITTLFSDISSLTIGCWNDKISLRWMPAIGKDESGVTRYDKDHRINTSIGHVKVATLLKIYEKNLKELVETQQDPGEKGKSVGVKLMGKEGISVLLIEYKRDSEGVPQVYLTLARKLTPAGADPSNIVRYQFNKIESIVDYNPAEGGEPIVEKENSEFEDFLEILRSRKLMTGLNSHATKYSAAFGGKRNNNAMDDVPAPSGSGSDSGSDFMDFIQ